MKELKEQLKIIKNKSNAAYLKYFDSDNSQEKTNYYSAYEAYLNAAHEIKLALQYVKTAEYHENK